MKSGFLMFTLLLVVFINCTTKQIVVSRFYNPMEKEILKETTKVINYNYGYDTVVNLDNVYPINKTYLDIEDNDRLLSTLRGFSRKSVVEFYEKIVMLKKITYYEMKKYEIDENWKEYTYLRKYLLPALDRYHDSIKKNIFIIDPSYESKVVQRNKIILEKVKEHYREIKISELTQEEGYIEGYTEEEFDWDSYFQGIE